MCRIAGILSDQQNSEWMYKSVKAMCDAMQHGGPDDEGIYLSPDTRVCLGHRRLALLDLSPAGHQPMAGNDERCWIVFNGEVYNFREIKAELEQKGHFFKSSSDTEVILAAYLEWGTESFKRFNGMFAFALLDTGLNQIFLVRDAAGIKPLYYHTNNKGELFFASEVKAFKKADPNWQENPDWRLLMLCFGHIPEPYTTLKEVYALKKGSYLQYDLESKEITKLAYRKLGFAETKILNKEEALHLVREKLNAAVERHLISDAPVGVFLSGGIDSSLLTLLAADKIKDQLHTLSVTFSENDFSEKEYQQAVIDQVNCKHQDYRLGREDLEANLDKIIAAYDQPSNDAINSWFISKCAHENGLKAVLSGLGSDEVFGGYPSFKRMDTIFSLKNMPSVLLTGARFAPAIPLKRLSWLKIRKPVGMYLTLRGLCTPETAAELTGLSSSEVIRKISALCFSSLEDSEVPKEQMASYLEFNGYMQNQLLKDSDYMSMQHSLELRVPFLDQEFLDAVFSIDTELLYHHKGLPKQLLIDTFRDLMPEKIWNRQKMGFSFPFQKWLGNIEQIKAGVSRSKTGKDLFHSFEQGNIHWSKLWAFYLSENFKS